MLGLELCYLIAHPTLLTCLGSAVTFAAALACQSKNGITLRDPQVRCTGKHTAMSKPCMSRVNRISTSLHHL